MPIPRFSLHIPEESNTIALAENEEVSMNSRKARGVFVTGAGSCLCYDSRNASFKSRAPPCSRVREKERGMVRQTWARWGDVNAFFGLMLDNVAALVLLVALIGDNTSNVPNRPDRFMAWFVVDWIIPGHAIGVLLCALIYSWLGARLARRTGRNDVTAMPLGLDTPSAFGVGLLVLIPTLVEAQRDRHMDHHTASVFAWNVGMVVLVLLGIFKTAVAPLGNWVRRLLPRAALLGPLAVITLALIMFLPMAREVAATPVIGLPTLAIVLVTLMGERGSARRYPGVVFAIVAGLILYVIGFSLGNAQGWEVVPLPDASILARGLGRPLPAAVWTTDWWIQVGGKALEMLPLVLPFGLATVIGGIECTESAEADGDSYDTRSILFGQGLATIVTGCCGGVIQTTPYYGHPAYKAMGAHIGYPLLAALVLAVLSVFGWFRELYTWVPQAALFPVIIYVGLQTVAHSVRVTPSRHYPAVALAAVPVLAYLALITLRLALGSREPDAAGAALAQTLLCLANGFVITTVLWAAALTALIDGQRGRAAAYLVIAGISSLVGLIHSPLATAPLAWPTPQWLASLPAGAGRLTPYHWAVGYALAAAAVFFWPRTETKTAVEDAKALEPADAIA
jgi:AGZA family xanthine/uracil permease-like MFS transporter